MVLGPFRTSVVIQGDGQRLSVAVLYKKDGGSKAIGNLNARYAMLCAPRSLTKAKEKYTTSEW